MISITKNGKPLEKTEYTYDNKTKTLSTNIDGVVIDSGHYSTIKAGDSSTIKAGYSSTIKAGYSSTIKAGYSSTIDSGDYSTINAGSSSTIDSGKNSTIMAGDSSTIDSGKNSTIKAGDSSTIKAGKDSVVARRDIFEVIIFDREMEITLCPYEIPGYICDGKYSVTGKPSIIADGILSEIVYTRKGKGCIVYKVKNHGSEKETYLIFRDGIFSHGETVKKAKEGLIYKISDRDTSKYENYTKETTVSIEEAIKMYRAITGACEEGTRYFVDNHKNLPKKATIGEVIKITEGQYNNESLVKFFENRSGGCNGQN